MNKIFSILVLTTYVIIGIRFNQQNQTLKVQDETIRVMSRKMRKFTERSYFTGCMENLNMANRGKSRDFTDVCLKNSKEYNISIWGNQ
jgi:folate-dependent tRNA-U54 methylase TrmFO/GidA